LPAYAGLGIISTSTPSPSPGSWLWFFPLKHLVTLTIGVNCEPLKPATL
jgi:hypothetical protein